MDDNIAAEWVVAIGTLCLAGATVALAVVAAFQDVIRGWVMRPKLDVTLTNAPPDCHKIPLTIQASGGQVLAAADSYYFRLRVKNSGNQRAEQVEVYAAELSKKQADGVFKRVDSFLPMNLRWAHVGQPFIDAISPDMEKPCDLGHIIDPSKRSSFPAEDNSNLGVPTSKTLFSFDLQVKPNTLGHLIAPGDYRLRLLVAAGNTKAIERTIEINLTGDWHDDEPTMLSEGIGLKVL